MKLVVDREVRTHVCRESAGEVFELLQVRTNLYTSLIFRSSLVQQHTQQSLCTTRILDRLRREPYILLALCFYCRKIELAIKRLVLGLLFSGRVLEEEDDADRIGLLQSLGIERYELLKLHALYTERFDQVCEDAL